MSAFCRFPSSGRSQISAVLNHLGFQVFQIDIPMVVAIDDHHVHAGHHSAGRVGAVGGRRDQRHVAVAVALRFVESADRKQARIFSLSAGIGLERTGRKSGHFAEPGFEFPENLLIPKGLINWSKRMDIRKLRPAYRNHFRSGIELHRTRAQRNHRMGQGKVFVLQALDIAHHLTFGMVTAKDVVGQKIRFPAQGDRQLILCRFG